VGPRRVGYPLPAVPALSTLPACDRLPGRPVHRHAPDWPAGHPRRRGRRTRCDPGEFRRPGGRGRHPYHDWDVGQLLRRPPQPQHVPADTARQPERETDGVCRPRRGALRGLLLRQLQHGPTGGLHRIGPVPDRSAAALGSAAGGRQPRVGEVRQLHHAEPSGSPGHSGPAAGAGAGPGPVSPRSGGGGAHPRRAVRKRREPPGHADAVQPECPEPGRCPRRH
jgi:hypothetical protein